MGWLFRHSTPVGCAICQPTSATPYVTTSTIILLETIVWCIYYTCFLEIHIQINTYFVRRSVTFKYNTDDSRYLNSDNSILSLISKWHESPNFFLNIVIAFRLSISQSMNNLKLWISQSGFSVPNYVYTTAYLKVQFVSHTECNVALLRFFFVKFILGKVQN